MSEIKFPTQRTYFITYTDTSIFSYGYVDPNQQMTSGQPELYQTTDEQAWITELQTVFNVAYPILPYGQVWGYQYATEQAGQEALQEIEGEFPNAQLNYDATGNFWYIVYEDGMQAILGEPTIIYL
jgi:hypothetical protein